jgi:hypothetical protein
MLRRERKKKSFYILPGAYYVLAFIPKATGKRFSQQR